MKTILLWWRQYRAESKRNKEYVEQEAKAW